MRPLCPVCNERTVAINYIKEDITHYRSRCDACARKGKKLKPKSPAWYRAGYRKKPACELCGFVAKSEKQLNVFHIDGNQKNVDRMNLKTVCLNCTHEVITSRKLHWKPADVTADF